MKVINIIIVYIIEKSILFHEFKDLLYILFTVIFYYYKIIMFYLIIII